MQVREELPALTTWQQIGLILATPGYNDGAAFLDEGDMADIARLLDEYKAERDAERDALRTDAVTLHKMLDETVAERDALREEHDEIIEELDTYGWWMDNPNMLERLKFALATSQEKSDDLANMQLAMRSTRQTE